MISTKRLGLLFAALLTATMTLGVISSAAWFTDSDQVAVTATSGEIDIDAQPGSFTVSNILPGVWTDPENVDIFNTNNSTTAVKYRLTDSFTGGNPSFYDELLVVIRHDHCVPGDRSAWPIAYQGPLANLNLTSASSSVATTLAPNNTHCYAAQFALPTTAGNAFQGLTATFNLVYDATQPENPGWAE